MIVNGFKLHWRIWHLIVFTLTQIKIRGKGLFADALTPGNSVKQNDKEFHESDSHKEEEE